MNAEEFWAILHAMPDPQPVSWRLYYNESGEPITYSMEELPGTYIEVDAETYARAPMHVRVQAGRLIELKSAVRRLAPADSGTACYPNNVAIVVAETEPHQRWSMKTYESY
jgi:hypothetical protein